MEITPGFPVTWPICWKCPISQCRRTIQKIPGSGPGSGSLPKFNRFFLVHDTFLVKF